MDDEIVRIRDDLGRLSETVSLIKAAVKSESVETRIVTLERDMEQIAHDVRQLAYARQRCDWDLLTKAIERAEVLQEIETSAIEEIDALKHQLSNLTQQVSDLRTRMLGRSFWIIAFLVILSILVVGALDAIRSN